jgi:hypothetical protein
MEYSELFTTIFHNFFDLEKIIFEFFNISENNIISVKLAKVTRVFFLLQVLSSNLGVGCHDDRP